MELERPPLVDALFQQRKDTMQIEIFREDSAFDKLAPEWTKLLAQSAADTIFLTPSFQRAWWETFGEEGMLYLVAARKGEELIGLAPLHRLQTEDGRQALHLVGGLEVADYLDIIAIQGMEEAVCHALLTHLVGRDTISWQVLELHNVPADSPSRRFLPKVAGELQLGFREEVEEVCPLLGLPSSWEEYLSMLSRKDRHEVRRKVRRIGREAQVKWYSIQGGEELEEAVEEFIALHQASAPEKDTFMDRRMQRFFRSLAQAVAPHGWLRLDFLEVNGERVASLFNFDYGDYIMVYNSGYQPQRYAHLSPGIVVLAYSIREAIRLGRKGFDFLRGDEEYKYRLGGKGQEIYQLTITRKD